jgi:hypothetical protein
MDNPFTRHDSRADWGKIDWEMILMAAGCVFCWLITIYIIYQILTS